MTGPEPGVMTDAVRQVARSLKVIAFDFDGVFTDNRVYVLEDGREAVCCSRADGLGLRRLERCGILPVVISTEVNPVVARRCEKLSVRCYHGVDDKAAVLQRLLVEEGATWNEAAFVGNDLNDAAVMGEVALPMIVRDAHPDVVELGRYRTLAKGGQGAVREICDVIAGLREG